MSADEQEASELIRQGRYFEQAHQWYKALYIAPIAERSFFLLIGLLAVSIGAIGFLAYMGLTPIIERPALIISNNRINDTVPSLTKLREPGMSVNDALRQYMVYQYVVSRETYRAQDFAKDSAFVRAHSSEDVAATYYAAVGPENPRNPAALLGAYGTRTVTIRNVTIDPRAQPQKATVRFSTEIGGTTVAASRTQWTATIEFNYSDAVVTEATDPETGEKIATLQQPKFQVVSYALTQMP